MNFNFKEHVDPYRKIGFATCQGGWIIWRRGTGGNTELLHLHVEEGRRRQGVGRHLLRMMLRRLRKNPPYASVFGFTRVVNAEARAWYAEMGFALTRVEGVYADGEAMVFSAAYPALCERHLSEGAPPAPQEGESA